MKTFYFSFFSLLLVFPSLVFSHHPLNGLEMKTFYDGVLSGFGHPLLGLDHLIFLIGVGILSYLTKNLFKLSLSFIAGSLVGILSINFGFYLEIYELIISFTLLAISYLFFYNEKIIYKKTILAFLGVFHGWAYGSILTQKEFFSNILFGYSFGLLISQIIIAFVGYKLFKMLDSFKLKNSFIPIFSGISIGVAVVSLFEILETNILNFIN